MTRDVTVTFDDGTTHVYQGVPADATPEQVTARASKDFTGKKITALDGGKKPAKDEPYSPAKLKDDPRLHDPKYRDELRGYGTGGLMFDEAKSGIASFAGLGGTVMDLMEKLPGVKALREGGLPLETPPGGWGHAPTELAKKALGVKGYMADPTSTGEKAAAGAANFLGQNIVLSPASLSKSLAKGGIGKLATDVATEGVSSAGGGAGFRLGEEAGAKIDEKQGNKTPWWQTLFGLGGGVAGGGLAEILGTQTAPKALSMAKNKLVPVLTKENAENAVKSAMSRDMRGALAADPDSVKRLRESLATAGNLNTKFGEKTGKTFAPDLAQATGSKSVEDLKRRLDLGSSEAVAKDLETQAGNKEALESARDTAFPATGDATRRAASADVSKAHRELFSRAKDVQSRQEALARDIQENGFTRAKGEQLRELGEQEFSTAYQAQQELYTQLDQEGRRSGFALDAKPLLKQISAIRKSQPNLFQETQVNAALGEIERILAKQAKPAKKASEIWEVNPVTGKAEMKTEAATEAVPARLSWDEYRSLQKHINNGLKGTGNVYVREFLDSLKTSAKESATSVNPALVQKLDDVNQVFGDVIQDIFRRGSYGEMIKEGAYGYRTTGSDIVRKVFLSKGEEGAKRFKDVFAFAPAATDMLRDGIIDEFAHAAIKEGKLDAGAARRFMARKDVSGFLQEFPEIRDQLSTWQKQQESLVERAKRLQTITDDIGDSALSKLAGTADTVGFLTRSANDYKVTQQLAREAKRNPELGKGVMRGYAEAMWNEKDPVAFLAAHEGNLKPIFDAMGKDHWENITLLAKGKEIASRTSPEAVYRAETEADPLKRVLGTSTSGLFSRWRNAFLYGITSKSWALVDVGGKYLFKVSQDDAKKAMETAFYDPKLAEDLAKAETKVNLPTISKQETDELIDSIKERFKLHGIRLELNAYHSAVAESRQEDVQKRVKQSNQMRQDAFDKLLNRGNVRGLR